MELLISNFTKKLSDVALGESRSKVPSFREGKEEGSIDGVKIRKGIGTRNRHYRSNRFDTSFAAGGTFDWKSYDFYQL